MSEYRPAYETLIRHEVYAYGTASQRFWSDIKGDPGGETAWGWSMRNIVACKLTPRECGLTVDAFTPGCLKQMPERAADDLYLKLFWNTQPNYALIVNQDVATKVFDAAPNMGPHNAHVCLQGAALDLGVAIDLDGIFGPKTLDVVNLRDPQALLAAMCIRMRDYYNAWVDAKPDLREQFRVGLLNRAAWTHP